MDVAKMLAELRAQRDDIDHAILSLERLANGRARRRGRPPGRKNETLRDSTHTSSSSTMRPKNAAG